MHAYYEHAYLLLKHILHIFAWLNSKEEAKTPDQHETKS